MDMMGRVGLVEIPILIAPDQKVWMDRMIKEGKIAIPPGGTLEKGSLYSMFVRMLLHNAMEEQKRQEALEADDEDSSARPEASFCVIFSSSSGSGFRSRACDHWNCASSVRPVFQ